MSDNESGVRMLVPMERPRAQNLQYMIALDHVISEATRHIGAVETIEIVSYLLASLRREMKP